MGDFFRVIVDTEAADDRAPGLAKVVCAWLVDEGIVLHDLSDCTLGKPGHAPGPHYANAVNDAHPMLRQLHTNGLEVSVGKAVFDSGQGDMCLVCQACNSRIDEPPERWAAAMAEWAEGHGPGYLACPKCGHVAPVTVWTYDPPWEFGSLGFRFWNWPRLSDALVESIRALLGHRVTYVSGKS